ncbi:MAG: class IV adenylate cyclase [Patescibacteria group bacterium]|jgi:predicted adenylyl cyclase CyaB
MKNVELKVKVDNFNKVNSSLKNIKAKFQQTLKQIDTYFHPAGDPPKGDNLPDARFKLREINNRTFELIYYRRPDHEKSKVSDFSVLQLDRKIARQMKNYFKATLGVKVIVKKVRRFWLYKHTRILLDEVSNLGKFLELETVVKGISLSAAKKEQLSVIQELGLNKYKKIARSYSDLLLKK